MRQAPIQVESVGSLRHISLNELWSSIRAAALVAPPSTGDATILEVTDQELADYVSEWFQRKGEHSLTL
jgi:hypothetical protein